MIKRSFIFWLNLSTPDRDTKYGPSLRKEYQTVRNKAPMAIKDMTLSSGIKYSILNDIPVHGRLFPARPLRLPLMPE